ncbi:hypothetical protein KR093_006425 [Drosophila rubida]|uniref:Receptor expression-enhancing protein n=1 Tax=Drosophila rubida TaxID=30044 RepID=A0AAD4PGQ2_9MUSC|nr:hypothetical protein KR093_006425 [Drosophila rubida]
MIGTLFSRLMILLFGCLYPGYASYKAIRTKDVNECTKWLMYWIVYAGFTCVENIADVFFFWFPLYYEIKVGLVLCLISPTMKGSTTLYTKFVQPTLELHEDEIDEYINRVHDKGYTTLLELSSKAANYVTDVLMQSGMKIIHLASSWAAHTCRVSKSRGRKQLARREQQSSRSSSLTDIETYCNERMIITELAGDDIEEYPQTFQRKSGLIKLSETMKRAQKSFDDDELFLPRSYSTSSIDTRTSQRNIALNLFNQQLAINELNQKIHLIEKPLKKANTMKGTSSSVASKRATRSTSRVKVPDANRESSKRTTPLWMS